MGLEISDNELWKYIKETHDISRDTLELAKDNKKHIKVVDQRLSRLEKCAGTLPRDVKYWSKMFGKLGAMVAAVTALVISIMEGMKRIGG